MYKKLLLDDESNFLLEGDDEELEKELDKVDDEVSQKVIEKTKKSMEKKQVYKDIHEKNPLFDYFNGNKVKLTNISQIKSLASKDTGILTKIGYIISTIALYILSSISYSASIIKKTKFRNESYMSESVTKQLLNVKQQMTITEDNILQKTTTYIKILYHSKKIIQSMTNILVRLYGGATQLLYVLSNISLTTISFILFSIGVLMIKSENNEKVFHDLSSRIKSVLGKKGDSAFHDTNKKGELVKAYGKLCVKYIWDMLLYIPSAIRETVKSAWNSIKNIPNLIKNFFSGMKKDSYRYDDDYSIYKEEILKEFINPLNIVSYIFKKLTSSSKVLIVLAAGVLVITLAVKTSNAQLPDIVKKPIDQLVEKSKEIVKKLTNETVEKQQTS